MDIWSILGIEPTSETAVIKKAYAAKAKEYHPEEHPEEFQRLQKAYKSALQYAKLQKFSGELTEEQTESKELEIAKEPEIANVPDSAKEPEIAEVPDSAREPESVKEPDKFRKAEQNIQENAGIVSENCDFDYGDIKPEDNETQFWEQFDFLIWHPYLRNDIVCWEFFLKQQKYRKLFGNEDFCRRFAERICKEGRIWDREMLLLFDRYLRAHYHRNEEGSGDVPLCWKKQMKRLIKKNPFFGKRFMTLEEQNIYNIIWIKKFDFGGAMNRGDKMEEYLKFYFLYAAEHKSRLEDTYKKSNAARRRLQMFLIVLAALVTGMCILAAAGSVRELIAGNKQEQSTGSKREQLTESKQEQSAGNKSEQSGETLEQYQQILDELEIEYEKEHQSETGRQEIDRRLDEVIDAYDKWSGKEEMR